MAVKSQSQTLVDLKSLEEQPNIQNGLVKLFFVESSGKNHLTPRQVSF